MRRTAGEPLVVNGWTIYAHPLFLDQVESLAAQVQRLQRRDPGNFARRNAAKRLAAIVHLAFEVIPQDPARPEYRLGDSLGKQHTHWFRTKFFQQYRLFFRFHAASQVIVLGWVNDEDNKRAYGRADDAYRVFGKMLASGRPPDDWDQLLAEARAASVRVKKLANQ